MFNARNLEHHHQMPPNPPETLHTWPWTNANMSNSDVTELRVLWLQVGVYLGKRDFVDRVDCVDPLGELDTSVFFQNKCWLRLIISVARDGHVLPLMFTTRWRHHHWSRGSPGKKRYPHSKTSGLEGVSNYRLFFSSTSLCINADLSCRDHLGSSLLLL